MNHCQSRGHPRVSQVCKILSQLVSGQLSFVNDGLAGERSKIKMFTGTGYRFGDGFIDITAQYIEFTLKIFSIIDAMRP